MGQRPAVRDGARIVCADLAVSYRGQRALEAVTGSFETGSLTAVVGPNGAGKSSLLRAIAGELTPSHGRVALAEPRPRIAYLAQAAEVDRRFPVTVSDVVLFGLWREIGAFRRPNPAQKERVAAAIHAVGLRGLERRLVGTLSAGQFQRVLFARLIVQDAAVILLDEPFAAIDEATTGDLLALIATWHAEGRTIVAVLHDLSQVRRHFPRTLLLAKRPVGWGPTEAVLSPGNVARAGGVAGAWDFSPEPTTMAAAR